MDKDMYKIERHRTFTSFYHQDDEKYKEYIDDVYGDIIINESVMLGEYDPDNKDEYIKRLIREDKISVSSVIIVLVGPNTYKRKHVDWEIYAGLSKQVNGQSGLVGILLPDFDVNNDKLPARLYDNVKSGYAKLYSWDYMKRNFRLIVDEAFNNRIDLADKVDNSREQMHRNLS